MSSVMTLKSYGTNRFGKIGARRMVSTLPYDAEVEWLYGFDGPFIDTGVLSNTNLAMEVVAKFDWSKLSSQSSYGSFIGCNAGGSGGAIFCGFTADQQNLRSYFGSTYGNQNVLIPINSQFNTFFCSKDISKINDTQSTTSGTPTIITPQTIYLFMNNTNWGGSARPSCYVKSARFWQNGVLIRDYVSVRIGSVGALYDRRGVGGMNPDSSARTDGLYFNRGTGAFIVSPDKIA